MPRIRTIKPEFCEDEILGQCSRDARLMFVALWTRADDHGRFRANPALLQGQLFPYDTDITPQTVAGWLAELVAAGRVDAYEVDGQRYGQVVNWAKHQRIDNAAKALHPPPPVDNDGRGPDDPSGAYDQHNPPVGGPPRTAANHGEPPLDLDQDQDQDQDPDRATTSPTANPGEPDWDEVWDTYTATLYAHQRGAVTNPAGWKRKVRRNAPTEHGPRARDLADTYVLDADTLGRVLAGEDSLLRYAPRRIEAS